MTELDHTARNTFVSQHFKYYIVHTLVTAISLAFLGWLYFVNQGSADEEIGIGTLNAQIHTLCKTAFLLLTGMLFVNAFLGPFFELSTPMKLTSAVSGRFMEAI